MDMYIGQSYFVDELGSAWTDRALAPYRAFIAALPDPLAAAARSLIGAEIGNSNLVHLPWLIAEPYGVSDDTAADLVTANAFMLTYFLASDLLFDAPAGADRSLILLATVLHAELVRRYDAIAPGKAAAIWADIVAAHATGVLDEEHHHALARKGAATLSMVGYEDIVIRKNRYGAATIHLLGARMNRSEVCTALQRVYDDIAVEIEFDDDLRDWREDLRDGRFTPVVMLLTEAADSTTPEDVERAIVDSTAVLTVLDAIDARLASAESLLDRQPFPHTRLSGWLSRHRDANNRLRVSVAKRQVYSVLGRRLAR